MTTEQLRLLDAAIQTTKDAMRVAEMFSNLCDLKDAEIARLEAVVAERDQTIEDLALGTTR